MRITILALGTRGDVQPYVALALALQRNGFTPKIAAPLNFESFIARHRISYAPIRMDTEEGLKSREGQAWLASGNTRAFIRHLNSLMERDRPALQKGCWEACQDADAIIATAMTLSEGITVAEKLRRPLLASLIYPLIPRSRKFPQFLVAAKDLPSPWLNYLSHVLFERIAYSGVRDDLNRWREAMSLPPMNISPRAWLEQNQTPILHHYGGPLFPKPGDWKSQNVLTGPLFVHGAPPAANPVVTEFLEKGESPVFLGFGSMPVLDPEGVLNAVGRVIGKLGIRAIVGAGWSHLQPSNGSKDLLVVPSADHAQLFPRCQALVHHGGAGTTFAGLCAQKPALVFSVFADQPFWGERLQHAGAGAHYRFSAFSENTLLAGLQRVLQSETKQRAKALGRQMDVESGAAESVQQIIRHLKGGLERKAAIAS